MEGETTEYTEHTEKLRGGDFCPSVYSVVDTKTERTPGKRSGARLIFMAEALSALAP
jgi:hypothetical protein